jgi:UDP-2,3-diacylglucosamine pyrophosphatase LpxH
MQLRWLAKIGGYSYDLLIRMNKIVNFFMKLMGKERIAFSKLIKMRVKEAVKFVNDFEQQAIETGRKQGVDTVVCGHVHTPQMRRDGSVLYLNSGDWVENLTALEYSYGTWSIYHYDETDYHIVSPRLHISPAGIEMDEEDSRVNQPQAVLAANFLGKLNMGNL